jgi:hypothetical protein
MKGAGVMTVSLKRHLPAENGTWSRFGATFAAAVGSWRPGAKGADSGLGAGMEVFLGNQIQG